MRRFIVVAQSRGPSCWLGLQRSFAEAAPAATTAGTSWKQRKAPTTAEAKREPITITDDSKIAFGAHKGQTFKHVFATEPKYCQWVVRTVYGSSDNADLMRFALYILRAKGGTTAADAAAPGAPENATSVAGAAARVARPSAEPHCSCGDRAVKLQKSEEPNLGRWYFVCGRPREFGCRFFLWSSEDPGTRGEADSVAPGSSRASGTTPKTELALERCEAEPAESGGPPPPEAELLAKVCGPPQCLAKRSFVLTGVHAKLTKDLAAELIQYFGGVVRTSVSGKTSYLVVLGPKLQDWKSGERAGPVEGSAKYKSAEARGIPILSLEELFSLIAAGGEDLPRNELRCFSLE